MKELEIISVNKEAPEGIKNMLLEYGYQDRAFLVHTDITTIYVVLQKPTKNEIKKFQNSLKIGIKIFKELNFFMLYLDENLSFEVPIIAKNTSQDFSLEQFGNACNLILVDANKDKEKFIIKSLRMIGLSENIFNSIKEGIKKDKNYSFDLYRISAEYLNQYSPQEFWKTADYKQSFRR